MSGHWYAESGLDAQRRCSQQITSAPASVANKPPKQLAPCKIMRRQPGVRARRVDGPGPPGVGWLFGLRAASLCGSVSVASAGGLRTCWLWINDTVWSMRGDLVTPIHVLMVGAGLVPGFRSVLLSLSRKILCICMSFYFFI